MRPAGSFGYLMKTPDAREIEEARDLTKMKMERLLKLTESRGPGLGERLFQICNTYRGELFLLSSSAIFGVTLVYQRQSTISALAFSAMRQCCSFLVCLFLVPLIRWTNVMREETEESQLLDSSMTVADRRRYLLFFSVMIAIGSTGGNIFQQIGVLGDSAGKAGFLGSFQVVFTPILDTVLHGQAVSGSDIYAAGLSLLGVFILSGTFFNVGNGLTVFDLSLLISGVFFSINITYGDRGAHLLNTLDLSMGDFGCSAVLGVLVCVVATASHRALGEDNSSDLDDLFFSAAARAEMPLVIGTALSQTLAVILAKVGFMTVASTRASLLIATNSISAALAGYAILGEAMQFHEIVGSAVMLCASALSICEFGNTGLSTSSAADTTARRWSSAGSVARRRSSVGTTTVNENHEMGQYGSVSAG